MQTKISIAILLIGLALMIGKIYYDSEPGLIPLLLVAIGSGWYLIIWTQTQRRHL